MKNRQHQSGPTQRQTRKPLAAGLCVVAASVLGVGFAAEAFGPTTRAGAITSAGAEVFVGISPVRLLDTRSGVGAAAVGAFGPAETRSLVAAGFEGIPTNATSLAINVTLPRSATSTSFVTVWPSGATQPNTSTSNATPGQAVPNFAVTALGVGGAIDVFNERGNTHIVIDVVGYYVPLPSGAPVASGGALMMGLGAPTDDMGDNGDFYIEQAEADMYQKEQNTWGDPLIELATEADAASGPHAIAADGPPAASDGADGDVYLDTDALEVYGPKANGAWGSGQPIGPDGVGSAFLSGSGAPAGVGVEGDLYLDTTNAVLYGPKVGSDWGSGQAVGPDGVGSTLLTGSVAPGATGEIGDTYLNIETLEFYGPKTIVGWPAPKLLNPGVDLQVGSGPPDPSFGVAGDVYIDQTTLLVYGPKPTDSSWGAGVDLAGPPTATSDSAFSAKAQGATINVAFSLLGVDRILPFAIDGVSVGTAIERVDADTLTFVQAGVYKVSFVAQRDAAVTVFGDVEVRVGGVAVDDSVSLVTAGLPETGVILVDAAAGDSLELWATGLVYGLAGSENVNFDGSIVVELIAVT